MHVHVGVGLLNSAGVFSVLQDGLADEELDNKDFQYPIQETQPPAQVSSLGGSLTPSR